MTHRFGELMFTPHVKAVQAQMGSRAGYARLAAAIAPAIHRLGSRETSFIVSRNSFYLATVSETGWPYVQHRGGPAGFVRVLDDCTIGFADYRGNKQYVSVGNLATDDRVSMFLMDYPNQRRLKLLGHARIVHVAEEPGLCEQLGDKSYPAVVERGVVISVEASDWNCSQHISPRFTEGEIGHLLTPLQDRIRALEQENGRLKGSSAGVGG